jgi:S1-C subfamily serine protease
VKDTRDTRDVRDTRREITRDRSVTRNRTNVNVNVNTLRSADMGLWFRSSNNGLIISDVAASGRIAKLGFREGDQIVSINGQRVVRERDFVTYLFADDVRDDRVKVIVLRDGREQVVFVEPAIFIEEMQVVHQDPLEDFGVVIDDRVQDRIVVWKVIPRTPAYYAGIRAGDVITVFNEREVRSPDDFVAVVKDTDARQVTVKVLRKQQVRTVDVSLVEEDVDVRQDTSVRDEVREDVRVAPRQPNVAPVVTPAPRVDVNVQPPRGGLLPRRSR